MKTSIAALCLMLAASPLALARDKATDTGNNPSPAAEKAAKKEPTAKQQAQQEKMRACSREAKDKKLRHEERKKFMSQCLKG